MNVMDSIAMSASGMQAQGDRMRIIAQNTANADSLATSEGGDPYRRRLVEFKEVMDDTLGIKVVKANKISLDRSEFGLKHLPGHPAADENGYVKTTNVKGTFESADMREAQRSYEANLSMLEMSRDLMNKLVDLLRV